MGNLSRDSQKLMWSTFYQQFSLKIQMDSNMWHTEIRMDKFS